MPARPRIVFIGGSGHHYLRGAVRDPADALWVLDPADEEASRQAADAFGASVQDGDLASAVRAFEPHAISVGTRYGHLGDHAAEALRLGVATVSDKPLASTWEQFETLEALATKDRAPPMVTEFDWRARANLRAARDLVADGSLGPVTLVIAQKTYKYGSRPEWYRDRNEYGGTLMWVCSHAIDAVRFVVGDASVVSARHGNAARPEIAPGEDHAVAVLDIVGGATAVCHADLARSAGHESHGDDRLTVRCRDGEIVVIGDRCVVTTANHGPADSPLPVTSSVAD